MNGCIFDTGNAAVVLPQDLVSDASAYPDSKDQLELKKSQSFSGCVVSAVKTLDELKIGSFVSAAKSVYICKVGDVGYVNIDALGPSIWKFSLGSNVVKTVTEIPAQLTVEPLIRSPEGHIAAHVGIEKSQILGALDTGSPSTIMDISVVQKYPSHFSEAQAGGTVATPTGLAPVTFYKVDGLKINGQLITLDGVAVFDFKLVNPTLLTFGWSAVFGEDLLKDRVWYADLEKNVWATEP